MKNLKYLSEEELEKIDGGNLCGWAFAGLGTSIGAIYQVAAIGAAAASGPIGWIGLGLGAVAGAAGAATC